MSGKISVIIGSTDRSSWFKLVGMWDIQENSGQDVHFYNYMMHEVFMSLLIQ